MAIKYYDDALFNKIQSWVRDPDMRILKPDETLESFRIRADKGGDRALKLPFINISRDKSFEILRLGRTPLSCSGKIVAGGSSAVIPLNAIPISVGYKIDVYAQDYDQADVYLRELIINLVNHPKITITVPYNDIKFHHNAYVRLLKDVEDNSDIPERLFKTQFTRWTLSVVIDDAYIFSAPTVDIPKIDGIYLDVAREQGGELIIDDSTKVV